MLYIDHCEWLLELPASLGQLTGGLDKCALCVGCIRAASSALNVYIEGHAPAYTSLKVAKKKDEINRKNKQHKFMHLTACSAVAAVSLLLLLHAGISNMTVSCCRSLGVVPDEVKAMNRRDSLRYMFVCCEALGM
jgi:hypothetical protein